jgi:hypothetical protein
MTRVTEIFVPGRVPSATYVTRKTSERLLLNYLDEGGSILWIAGQTKIGKTVLVRRVTPSLLEVSGGAVEEPDDLWNAVVMRLGAFTDETKTIEREAGNASKAELSGKINLGVAEIGSRISGRDESSDRRTHARTRRLRPYDAAAELLRTGSSVLFIDDFHYISPTTQTALIRGIKPLLADGVRVVIASVPHRADDALRREADMAGRVEPVRIPDWTAEELREIAWRGFNELNLVALPSYVARLADEALGSPHLMQAFCLRWCRESEIETRPDERTRLAAFDTRRWDTFFAGLAGGASKIAYETLATGSHNKARASRRLIDDTTTDIYGAILLAIGATGPPSSVNMLEVRLALKEILADPTPSNAEIRRALTTMSKAARRLPGEPVFDFNEHNGTLNISEPFFRYYLRWGASDSIQRFRRVYSSVRYRQDHSPGVSR